MKNQCENIFSNFSLRYLIKQHRLHFYRVSGNLITLHLHHYKKKCAMEYKNQIPYSALIKFKGNCSVCMCYSYENWSVWWTGALIVLQEYLMAGDDTIGKLASWALVLSSIGSHMYHCHMIDHLGIHQHLVYYLYHLSPFLGPFCFCSSIALVVSQYYISEKLFSWYWSLRLASIYHLLMSSVKLFSGFACWP